MRCFGGQFHFLETFKIMLNGSGTFVDISDTEDTDFEDSPRYRPVPKYKPPPQRPLHRRKPRRESRDDKSTLTSTIKSKDSTKPAPKTMKELFDRRLQATNRYKTSGFNATKDTLLKDSDLLNKNEHLNKMTSKFSNENVPAQKVPEKQKEATVSSTDRDMRTPPPEPAVTENVVKTMTTVNIVTKNTVTTRDPDTISTTTWRGNEGTKYLDEAETQIGIDTARDQDRNKDQNKVTFRPPSRASFAKHTQEQLPLNKSTSRAPSRQSVQETKPQTKELPPVRPPSRSSIISKTNKSTVSPQRRSSNASIMQVNRNIQENQKEVTLQSKPTENALFLTEPFETENDKVTTKDTDSKIIKTVKSHNEKDRNPASRRNSTVSVQNQNIRKTSILVSKNTVNGVRVSTQENSAPNKSISQTNGHVSPPLVENGPSGSKQRNSITGDENKPTVNIDTPKPKPKITTSVSVKDKVETKETSNVYNNKSKKTGKAEQNGHSDNSDPWSTKTATYHGKPTKGKKGSTQRSRSRTPKKTTKHDSSSDVKVPREEYEQKGHDGRRGTRRSTSPRGRKRSTSRSRKGRKRSRSKERKNASPKSRFPDIQKKDGKWEIIARNTDEKVTETERVITPKPSAKTTENQWKSLVEKYIRQPSPKIGKGEDRSLLDSNFDDDDDDDTDIFKRASKRYGLDDYDDDDDDSI